jgi:hypothetical protein
LIDKIIDVKNSIYGNFIHEKMLTPKSIKLRLKELNVGCKNDVAKKIYDTMKSLEVSDFESVLAELINDPFIPRNSAETTWHYVLMAKRRQGEAPYINALISAVKRVGAKYQSELIAT